jgi:hypothetical protein
MKAAERAARSRVSSNCNRPSNLSRALVDYEVGQRARRRCVRHFVERDRSAISQQGRRIVPVREGGRARPVPSLPQRGNARSAALRRLLKRWTAASDQ